MYSHFLNWRKLIGASSLFVREMIPAIMMDRTRLSRLAMLRYQGVDYFLRRVKA
jgi:hypothetical protein